MPTSRPRVVCNFPLRRRAARSAPPSACLVSASDLVLRFGTARSLSGVDLDQIQADYQKALRAWHVAWTERVEWHRRQFSPVNEREQSLVYEHVLEERQQLKDAEERAYDRFLRTRDVLAEALRDDNWTTFP